MVNQSKSALRTQLRELRNNIPDHLRDAAEYNINAHLQNLLEGFSVIAAYYAINNEVNVSSTTKNILSKGKTLCLPSVFSGSIVYHQIEDLNVLQNGKFAMEPPHDSKIIQPQVVITPLLGYSAGGDRIGYGLGYYDRYFAANPDCLKIGVAFAIQKVATIPAELHDQPLDMVVTEEGVIKFNANN